MRRDRDNELDDELDDDELDEDWDQVAVNSDGQT